MERWEDLNDNSLFLWASGISTYVILKMPGGGVGVKIYNSCGMRIIFKKKEGGKWLIVMIIKNEGAEKGECVDWFSTQKCVGSKKGNSRRQGRIN